MKTKTIQTNAGRRNRDGRLTARPGAAKIMAGVRELDRAMNSGRSLKESHPRRTVQVNEPGDYSPADVRKLRDVLGVSQSVFAKLLGVSSELVENWEQSVTVPRPIARRLLDEISRDPRAFAKRVFGSAA